VRRRSILSAATLGGFVAGFLAGFTLWSRQQVVDQRSLFSRNPVRRLAALGVLRGRSDEQAVSVLREYLAWEPRPKLRRRARRLLRCAEHTLGQHTSLSHTSLSHTSLQHTPLQHTPA